MLTAGTSPKIAVIVYGEYGKRIGESHHRSTISDATVELMRQLHDDQGYSYRRISESLGISFWTVYKICAYKRRACLPVRYRKMVVQ